MKLTPWRPLAELVAVTVVAPATVYWLIERTSRVETADQRLLLVGLAAAGLIVYAIRLS